MIVFDLRCGAGHVFESWFGSSAAYEDQRERGLIACPMCGSAEVSKAVMAPNVAAKGNRAVAAPAAPKPPADMPPELVKAAMAALAEAQTKALQGSKWVGMQFADRARAMHVGDEERAPIHGQATPEQTRDLIEEGVAVAPLPFPVVPPEACN